MKHDSMTYNSPTKIFLDPAGKFAGSVSDGFEHGRLSRLLILFDRKHLVTPPFK